MKTYKPHSPALEEWPQYVKDSYYAGCKRIDELRKQVDDDGVVLLPFQCYGCDKMRDDYALTTGDGCPMCLGCVGRCEDALEGVEK